MTIANGTKLGKGGPACNESTCSSSQTPSTICWPPSGSAAPSYCRTELRAPWAFAVRPADVPVFHVISDGASWLEVDGVDDPLRLTAGDVVLLTTGRGHRLSDDPGSPTRWLDDIIAATPPADGHLAYGGTGPRTEMICGCFQLEGGPSNPLLLSLPPLLRLDAGDPRSAEWLDTLLSMLRLEVAHVRPGADAMLARLADLVITQAIRAFLTSFAADDPQLGALRDRRIAKAIRLLHADPSRPWTVEDMAAEVAMSRSGFAATFRQLTGESPVRYLTRCRLATAAASLANTDQTMFAIAQQVGYDSETSLAKAFTRTFGITPGAYRRRAREPLGGEPIQLVPEISSAADTATAEA